MEMLKNKSTFLTCFLQMSGEVGLVGCLDYVMCGFSEG